MRDPTDEDNMLGRVGIIPFFEDKIRVQDSLNDKIRDWKKRIIKSGIKIRIGIKDIMERDDDVIYDLIRMR